MNMFLTVQSRQRRLPVDLLLASLLACTATAELFQTASTPAVQDGIVRRAQTTCPVAQDGYTSNTFPWTHNPTCVNAVLPNEDGEGLGIHRTFCTFTNSNYNNGRGISFVVTPEVAATVNSETYGLGIGGIEGQLGEEMGMWEVKQTKEKGKGLFAKKDIAAIFAGESLIVNTPVLFITKQLLETPSTARRQLVLKKAVEQLPQKTREAVEKLARNKKGGAQDIIETNGITVKWPWEDEVPQLLAVTPEVAVRVSERDDKAKRSRMLTRISVSTMGVARTHSGVLMTTPYLLRYLPSKISIQVMKSL